VCIASCEKNMIAIWGQGEPPKVWRRDRELSSADQINLMNVNFKFEYVCKPGESSLIVGSEWFSSPDGMRAK